MAFIKFKSGYVSQWDDTIKIGELITTYNDGYHILVSINYREPPDKDDVVECDPPDIKYAPIFVYRKVMKSDGTLVTRNTEQSCDASYCRRVTRESAHAAFADAVKRESVKLDNILKYL